MASPIYIIQPAFTGGEISPDVASRVDIDKYQLALLQAENVIVRPYGSVKKRTGTMMCGETKYSDKKTMLRRFDFTTEISYLLEIGHKYIRVWRDGVYLNVELETPFEESVLASLRFIQSIDVMYICSGKYPVKKLCRYSETEWTMEDVDFDKPPFGDINDDTDLKMSTSGTYGEVTLTTNKDFFVESMVGDWLKLSQDIEGEEANISVEHTNTGGTAGTYTSDIIHVGDTWKIITHGDWVGKVTIYKSTDNGATWKICRTYTSNDDYNPTESDTVDEYCLLKAVLELTEDIEEDKKCSVDISSYSYTHHGYIEITGYTSATEAIGVIDDYLGTTEGTADFYISAWNARDGYPACATFFQDRLCFGGSDKYPQRVWMSRNGDYENFEVESSQGTVMDDSGVTADLLSLKAYRINHMDVGTDLVVMTEGNEWTISGAETVKPSAITPRAQLNYGCSDVTPVRVGARVVYVQRRGNVVRDMGYNYDTDSYTGADLSLLARHLVEGHELIDSAYAQEPDSLLYFVRGDGAIIALTYVIDQKVFAWSRFVTDGQYMAIAACQQGTSDTVYVVAKRTIGGEEKSFIERFAAPGTDSEKQHYLMTDCSKIYSFTEKSAELTGLDYLEGKAVDVLGDNYFYEDLTVEDGKITLPEACLNVSVGLPVKMIIEQPNFDIGNTQQGTLQGRKKQVSSAILRLRNSAGGSIGVDEDSLTPIIYDAISMDLGDIELYTGDIEISLAAGGYNKNGRTYIEQTEPYPFILSAIIREVTLGG